MVKIINNLNEVDVTDGIVVVVHGGPCHADEVYAIVVLERIYGKVYVLRCFKVPEKIGENVIICDIGYGKYDHHQPGGNGERENGVPYAAAGLIWKDFGMEALKDTCNPEFIWKAIDKNLVQGIDAIDNGKMPKADYPAQAMTFSKMVSMRNPTWDSSKTTDEGFIEACDFARRELDILIKSEEAKARAQGIVDEAIAKSEGHIMVLERFVPWQEYIFLSENLNAADILFVVFPSSRGGYNWQCVPDSLGSFGQRKSVPRDWNGKKDAELQEITGVETATFCHPNGFIGGAETFEGAYALARLAVEA